jgi:glucose/arabinose dehydrogenase
MAVEELANWWAFPGFKIEVVATGLDLPVNIAFVPGDRPGNLLCYVTELYGKIKVITGDGAVYTYAEGLLNYEIEKPFPQGGTAGVIGICVEPATGDLYVSMVYMENGEFKNKLVRTSSHDGLRMDSMTTIIDNIPSTIMSHQVQMPSIGFDGKIYLNVGDGTMGDSARNCSGVSILTLKSNETHTEGTRRLANSTRRIPFGPGVARMRWMAVSDLFPQGASVSSWPTKPLSSGNTLFQNL